MKKITVLIIISVLVVSCTTQKVVKADYVLPAEMSPQVQAEYRKLCDKGKVLYAINCSGCHSKVVKGKELIPDFTPDQLEAYRIRMANATHESRMGEEQVNAEELSLILTFLSYKTKSNLAPPKTSSVDSH